MDHQEPLAECQVARAKMETRLDGMEKHLEALVSMSRETLTLIKGTDTESGLVIDVDRLKQERKSRVWWNRTVAAAIVGLVVDTAVNLFRK